MSEWNIKIMDEFRANEGKVGGMFEKMPLLILHSTGARSGNKHQTPVVYMEDKGSYAVFASMGGAPKSPAWYHNLVANPEAKIEIGSETKKVKARVAGQPERDELYNRNAAMFPQFAEYETRTTRKIPVVVLEPVN